MDNTPVATVWIGRNDDSELFTKACNKDAACFGANRNETENGMTITAKKCDVVCTEGGSGSAAFRCDCPPQQ